jgi:hypothetical protein
MECESKMKNFLKRHILVIVGSALFLMNRYIADLIVFVVDMFVSHRSQDLVYLVTFTITLCAIVISTIGIIKDLRVTKNAWEKVPEKWKKLFLVTIVVSLCIGLIAALLLALNPHWMA